MMNATQFQIHSDHATEVQLPKVLLVDDRPENLIAMETVLKALDVELVKAGSGNEALSMMLRHAFAMVLLDVQMPEMDGFEVASLMRGREVTRLTPIIFVTAISQDEIHALQGYEVGAVDYLSKPIDPHILKSKVQVFLDLHRYRSELMERTRKLEREVVRRREAEQALQQAYDDLEIRVRERTVELERSNKELDDFCYIASHDLKEPLRGIRNYSSFLLEDYEEQLDEEGQEKLHTLVRLTGRMETLIDTLLHYSRVGRVDLAVEGTDLGKVVEEVVDSLHIRLQEEGVGMRIPRPLPIAHCDSARIAEVFRNLITNALKYNDKSERWIEIGYQGNEPTANSSLSVDGEVPITFYVRDNGIGIQQKHQESIFRIFRRLHGRDKFGGGTGAGLTIVQKIVERHGGCIRVESVFGEGTTFYFTLG